MPRRELDNVSTVVVVVVLVYSERTRKLMDNGFANGLSCTNYNADKAVL